MYIYVTKGTINTDKKREKNISPILTKIFSFWENLGKKSIFYPNFPMIFASEGTLGIESPEYTEGHPCVQQKTSTNTTHTANKIFFRVTLVFFRFWKITNFFIGICPCNVVTGRQFSFCFSALLLDLQEFTVWPIFVFIGHIKSILTKY